MVTGVLALACSGLAVAHDTWFVPQPPSDRGEVVLALGTGTQYPKQEVSVLPEQVQAGGCIGDGVHERSLRRVAERPHALVLRTPRPVPAGVGLSCWARLVPIDIEIEDAIVDVYFDEIRASPALRERWARLRAAGVKFRETYVKHARIELEGRAADAASARAIDGMGLDARIETLGRPLRVGQVVRFQLLRDGQPLAGQPVQLRSDLTPAGLWRVTDAEGRIELALPLAGRWMLRLTDLRAADGDRWASRFLTLGFDVLR